MYSHKKVRKTRKRGGALVRGGITAARTLGRAVAAPGLRRFTPAFAGVPGLGASSFAPTTFAPTSFAPTRFAPTGFAPARSFATRPDPKNVRLSLVDFDALETGPSLKARLSPEALKELGLAGRTKSVAALKASVFKRLVAEDRIRGQPGMIELAGVRFAIKAAETAKGAEGELSQLKAREAELVAKYGDETAAERVNASSRVNVGSFNASEEEIGALAGRASEVRTKVLGKLGSSGGRSGDHIAALHTEKAVLESAEASTEDSAVELCAQSAGMATEAAIEKEVLQAGAGAPSKIAAGILGVDAVTSGAAAAEAGAMYSRAFGKGGQQFVPTAEGLAAAGPKTRAIVPPEQSAVGMLEYVKSYTPYGMALQKLSGNMRLASKNVEAFKVLAVNIVDEGAAQAKYNGLVDAGLKVILENSTRAEIVQITKVFNPQRMLEFKSAMVTLFSHSVTDATTVFNMMVTYIIPRAKYNEKLIDSLISQIRLHPGGAIAELQKLAGLITAEEVKTLAASAQAVAKGSGWFRIKSFYTALLAGGGAVVLFLANYMNTPDMKTFAATVGDAKNDLLGELEKSPSYQSAAEVGGRVRDGILLKVMGQVPAEMAKNDAFSAALAGVNLPNGLKPKRTWYEYMMVSFGYNPVKSEDRRKFKELGTKAATYTGGAIAAALVQGLASTIAATVFKR